MVLRDTHFPQNIIDSGVVIFQGDPCGVWIHDFGNVHEPGVVDESEKGESLAQRKSLQGSAGRLISVDLSLEPGNLEVSRSYGPPERLATLGSKLKSFWWVWSNMNRVTEDPTFLEVESQSKGGVDITHLARGVEDSFGASADGRVIRDGNDSPRVSSFFFPLKSSWHFSSRNIPVSKPKAVFLFS
jgi:hypothetical protein